MPKLNVQQNNQNVIQSLANGVAIGQLNGIIKCDGANNFSVAEAGGGGGRNLLDNPFFTVNQRGQSSYTNASGFSESVDRWKIANKTTLAVVSGGVTLTTTSEISLQQNTEYDLRGETVTASVKVGGVVYSGTTTVPSSGFNLVTLSINGLSVDVRIGYSSGLYFRINMNSNTASLTLQAVKLELGSVSTLANDTPPDYGEELRKCMRYFVRFRGEPIGVGYISSNLTNVYLHITTGVQMAKVPTASLNGAIQVRGASGTIGVLSISVYNQLPTEGANVVLSLSSQSSTTSVCTAYFNAVTNYIDLSADL